MLAFATQRGISSKIEAHRFWSSFDQNDMYRRGYGGIGKPGTSLEPAGDWKTRPRLTHKHALTGDFATVRVFAHCTYRTHILCTNATSMMLPTIDEEKQVLFNFEGDIEKCTRCNDDADASFCYRHDGCETQIMLPNIHKEYQENFDFEGDIQRDNDSGSRSEWKWIAVIFLILFIAFPATITVCFSDHLRWLRSATVEITSVHGGNWNIVAVRYLGPRIR